MTKKDYIALALALKAKKPVYAGDMKHMDYTYHSEAYGMWKDCVIAVVEALAADNPKFSKGKFVAACGVPNALDK